VAGKRLNVETLKANTNTCHWDFEKGQVAVANAITTPSRVSSEGGGGGALFLVFEGRGATIKAPKHQKHTRRGVSDIRVGPVGGLLVVGDRGGVKLRGWSHRKGRGSLQGNVIISK